MAQWKSMTTSKARKKPIFISEPYGLPFELQEKGKFQHVTIRERGNKQYAFVGNKRISKSKARESYGVILK